MHIFGDTAGQFYWLRFRCRNKIQKKSTGGVSANFIGGMKDEMLDKDAFDIVCCSTYTEECEMLRNICIKKENELSEQHTSWKAYFSAFMTDISRSFLTFKTSLEIERHICVYEV